MAYGMCRGQEKIPAPYVIFAGTVGIGLLVGRASPRGIRKVRTDESQ
jgi:hypothetical protein